MPSHAAYVYCLVRSAARPPSASSPSGILGAGRPDALPVSPGLWVIVADVPLDTYGFDALESSLRDLDWVSRVALAHEAVVEHFIRARGATVIPMKMFTMFATRERAVDDMRGRRRQVSPIFRRIAAADEWGVRITRQPRSSPGSTQRATSGAEFLAAKKRARDEAAASDAAAIEAAESAFTSLRRIARAATRRDDAPSAGVMPPLLDAAFLVPRAKRTAFKAAVKRAASVCRRTGGDVSLTGPWPAYNFVQPRETS